MEKKKNYSLNLVLVGDSGVGKTSFLNRLLGRQFEENTLSTFSSYFELLDFNLQNYNIKIKIWDTAGKERFRAECGNVVKKADIIIYLRDNRKEDNLDYWLEFLNDNADIESDDIKMFFCLNKTDLFEKNEKDKIFENLKNKAQKYKAIVFAFSLKNDNDFENMIKLLIQNFSISLINNAINSHKEEFNICLVGPSMVGKTSLIERLINNDFIPSTVMTQKLVKNYCYVDLLNNNDTIYNYYYIPGQEKIMKEEFNSRILEKMDIIIFVNDNKHKKIEDNIVGKIKNLNEKNIIICVNKSDLIKNKKDFIKEFQKLNKEILINNTLFLFLL